MKIPSIIKRKKLQASTARRSRALGLADGMDYEQMSEPNMKLSRALLIVLVLHIVAVAGIVAFNTIKTRETMSVPSIEPLATSSETAPVGAAPSTSSAMVAVPNEIRQVAAKSKTEVAEKPTELSAKASTVADSGKIYTVVKGDNPVTIARRLKIAEADLLELNQITDPRRLQIGQKLHIPAPTTTTKHKSE
jgi:LysM repeat protein